MRLMKAARVAALAAAGAMASCPQGWLVKPKSSFRYDCYHLTPPHSGQFSSSLGRCVELCAVNNAVPACLSSAEEIDFVQNAWGSAYFCASCSPAWSGAYSTAPTALAFTKCVDGAMPFDTQDREAAIASGRLCSGVVGGGMGRYGGMDAVTCDKYGTDPTPCICGGPASASKGFDADLVLLEDAAAQLKAVKVANVARFFSAYGMVLLAPTLIIILKALAKRLLCRWNTGTAHHSEEHAMTESRTEQRLRAVGKEAASLRVRVSFTLFQVGLLFFGYGWAPIIMMTFTRHGSEEAHGPFTAWLPLSPMGAALMLLAIRPTDVIIIRIVSAVIFTLSLLIGVMMVPSIIVNGEIYVPFLGYALVGWMSAAVLARPMLCCGKVSQVPRSALRRLWLGARLLIVGLAGVSLNWPIAYGVTDEANMMGALIFSIISIVVAAMLTPTNRGRAHRIIGGFGRQGTKEAEAATISALIGGGNASLALTEGAKRFRALPLSAITEEDLASSSDSGLHAKTQPSKLGEVAGFVSHSWSDAGPDKYVQLHAWAAGEEEQSASLVWLDVRQPVSTPPPPGLRISC